MQGTMHAQETLQQDKEICIPGDVLFFFSFFAGDVT